MNWQEKIIDFCERFDIPLNFLADTMNEPKVVPMIRGKAFEFSVMIALQEILPKEKWEVTKPVMNAQTGFHDIDVRIRHKEKNKILRVECKLAKKDGYRIFPDGHSEIRVKCMRSRTLGAAKVKELAPKWGVDKKVLTIHNDQYLPSDFDILICSIGNAFYRTDKKTGFFEWRPTKDEGAFLKSLNPPNKNNLKSFAFGKMYLGKAQDLVIGSKIGVVCTRGKCKNKKNCGFIPNYPIIRLDSKTNKPVNGWIPIEEGSDFLEDLISNR